MESVVRQTISHIRCHAGGYSQEAGTFSVSPGNRTTLTIELLFAEHGEHDENNKTMA